MRLTRDALSRALPELAGTVRPPRLGAAVDVWRDPEGIPHILAASARDAFYAQGFVHAQDRLWHMEYDRRRAQGRFAEYAGAAAVAQDVHLRRLRLAATARDDYETVNGETRAMLDAYADGVNGFLAVTRTLPVEFLLLDARPGPWAPWDSLAVFKIRHVEMGSWQSKLWRARLLRRVGSELASTLCSVIQMPPSPTLIVPPGGPFPGPAPDALPVFDAGAAALADVADLGGGSNSWALAGSRTASGKPLIAGDPHRGLDVPGVYYQNHLACPEFDAIGLSFPGTPGLPHFGHNRFVAWCVTHAMGDYQDLFIERFDRDDPRRYWFRGDWRRADVVRETVRVRGGEPVEFDVTSTHHGPVALGDPKDGCAIAFRYTSTAEPNHTSEALLPVLRAGSADALEAAMRPWVEPANNFVFADVDGTVGYRTRGRIPIRHAANAWLPVPGWDGEHEWQGAIPFEEMPAMRNPETGWIATANSRITGPEYPHYLGLDYAPDFRTRRIIERLRTVTRGTAADMAAIHADRVSIPAIELVACLDGVAPTGLLAQAALARLRAWDGVMAPEAVGPTIYTAVRDRLMRNLLGRIFGPLTAEAFGPLPSGGVGHVARLRARLAGWIRDNDRTLLPAGEDWPDTMARALEEAVTELSAALGPDTDAWRWSRQHVAQPSHPLSAAFPEDAAILSPRPVAVGGEGDTVQAGSFIPGAGYQVTGTSVARYVFDLGDWNPSAWIVPHGASGHPGSPHFSDQTEDWAAVRLRPMRYEWARIRAEAEHHQRLEPAAS